MLVYSVNWLAQHLRVLVVKSDDLSLMFVLLKIITSTGKIGRGERGNVTFVFQVPVNRSCKIEVIVS